MNINEIEAARTEWLEKQADHHRHDDYQGEVTFYECATCGQLVWGRTSKEGSGIRIEPLFNCSRCQEVQQRSPELAAWVLNVIAKSLRDNQP